MKECEVCHCTPCIGKALGCTSEEAITAALNIESEILTGQPVTGEPAGSGAPKPRRPLSRIGRIIARRKRSGR